MQIMEKKKNSHGGARAGAGRPTISPGQKRVTVTFSMPPELKARLQAEAARRGMSGSELMAEILGRALK